MEYNWINRETGRGNGRIYCLGGRFLSVKEVFMDSVIDRLAHIESGADKILQDSIARKSELNDAMKKKTEDFDRQMDNATNDKIEEIKLQLQRETDAQLAKLRENVKANLSAMQDRFENQHDAWTDDILKKILV